MSIFSPKSSDMSNSMPPFIQEGALFGLVSPAGKIEPNVLPCAEHFLAAHGFRSRRAPHAEGQYYQFSARDNERTADMQAMIDDPEVDVIWCCRGGYGAARIIEALDFSRMGKKPKWIVGYSDITVFHASLSLHQSMVSIHGPMPVNLPGEQQEEGPEWSRLIKLLQGEGLEYQTGAHPLNIEGSTSGQLFGGNLSILSSLRGTKYDFDPRGKILFIEEVGEQIYHLDRMMQNLKLGGKLKNLSGLVVGHLTDMKNNSTPFPLSARGVIHEAVKQYGYPVLFDFPAGHETPNEPMLMGARIKLQVNGKGGKITYL
ncbi:MAG: LD-carboxypeptidase [Marinilabilia sp.]